MYMCKYVCVCVHVHAYAFIYLPGPSDMKNEQFQELQSASWTPSTSDASTNLSDEFKNRGEIMFY